MVDFRRIKVIGAFINTTYDRYLNQKLASKCIKNILLVLFDLFIFYMLKDLFKLLTTENLSIAILIYYIYISIVYCMVFLKKNIMMIELDVKLLRFPLRNHELFLGNIISILTHIDNITLFVLFFMPICLFNINVGILIRILFSVLYFICCQLILSLFILIIKCIYTSKWLYKSIILVALCIICLFLAYKRQQLIIIGSAYLFINYMSYKFLAFVVIVSLMLILFIKFVFNLYCFNLKNI